jgi:predicted NAD/FAD-dependent oxidoreductase
MTSSNVNHKFDVAVIGAGLAGLVCAQQLKQSGYQVAVVEKSRGVGGRLATRRLQNTFANHGVRYLSNQGALSEQLIQTLLHQDILQPWDAQICKFESGELQPLHSTYYTVATGLTAVAKFLATGLEIYHSQRLESLTKADDQHWQLGFESSNQPVPPLIARSVVLAIPAPQALPLLKPLLSVGLPVELVRFVESVEFDPCLSVIATYTAPLTEPLQQAIHCSNPPELAWISCKRSQSPQTPSVAVIQSTAAFAQQHLDAPDLKPAGQQLLQLASSIPGLAELEQAEFQVHRWRYAFVRASLDQEGITPNAGLKTTLPLPLVCSGDWCSGKQIENALESGLAAACQISELLGGTSLGGTASADWTANLPELMRQLLISLC